MRGGSVAEKSAVWRVFGVAARIASRSSAKPMSSISSASSRTSACSAVERERLAVHVVERAAGRRDDDVDAPLQGVELRDHRRAAVDRQHAHADLLAVAVDGLGDLHRELARRHEDEGRRGRSACSARRRSGGGSAARTRPSCRCRSPPARGRRGPRAAAGSTRSGSESAPRSRGPRAPGRAARRGRGRRRRSRAASSSWPHSEAGRPARHARALRSITSAPVKVFASITPHLSVGDRCRPVFFAGPCVIESRAHALKMAKAIKQVFADCGAADRLVYKSSFDKANRSAGSQLPRARNREGARDPLGSEGEDRPPDPHRRPRARAVRASRPRSRTSSRSPRSSAARRTSSRPPPRRRRP